MNPRYDYILSRSFPNLYRDRHGDMRETAMCWGFECGDGWVGILWQLSRTLENEILKLDPKDRPDVRAVQVKEKFGTLRFYMSGETPEMSKAIRLAEDLSEHTCERCGRYGVVMGRRWLYCSCLHHAESGDLGIFLRVIKRLCPWAGAPFLWLSYSLVGNYYWLAKRWLRDKFRKS
jgi:hypothetical protein